MTIQVDLSVIPKPSAPVRVRSKWDKPDKAERAALRAAKAWRPMCEPYAECDCAHWDEPRWTDEVILSFQAPDPIPVCPPLPSREGFEMGQTVERGDERGIVCDVYVTRELSVEILPDRLILKTWSMDGTHVALPAPVLSDTTDWCALPLDTHILSMGGIAHRDSLAVTMRDGHAIPMSWIAEAVPDYPKLPSQPGDLPGDWNIIPLDAHVNSWLEEQMLVKIPQSADCLQQPAPKVPSFAQVKRTQARLDPDWEREHQQRLAEQRQHIARIGILDTPDRLWWMTDRESWRAAHGQAVKA